MTAAPKPDVRFIVHFERSTGTLSSGNPLYTLTLEACYLGADRYGPSDEIRVRSPQFNAYGGPVPELDSFTVHAQAARGSSIADGWYGLGYDYSNPYRVDLDYAQAMAKVLRKVQRAIDKHRDEFGYSMTPETYCAVVARAAGATGGQVFGIRDKQAVDGTGYRWMGPSGLASLLADTLAGKRDDQLTVSRWG